MIRRHIGNVADNKTEELLRYFQRQYVYMQGKTLLTPWYMTADGSIILVHAKSHKPSVVNWLPHKMSHNSELTVIRDVRKRTAV